MKTNPMTRSTIQLFLLPLLLLVLSTPSLYGANYTTDTDILYRDSLQCDAYQHERCRLDLYRPTDQKAYPTVIWFHGGGLTAGHKSIPRELKEQGVAVVAVNYRLSPRVKVHDCLTDAAAAVAWVFRNIEQYGGNRRHIVVAGHSAGAYLTAMVGFDKRWLRPYDIDPDSILMLAPLSGNGLCHMVYREERGLRRDQPFVDDYAPMYHVRPDAPPTLLITGDRTMEMFGRYEEVAFLWRILGVNGHTRNWLYELQGYDHGGMAAPGLPLVLRHTRELIKQESKKQ